MPRPNRTATRCSKCGTVEHTTSQCSFEHRVCFQCYEPGHESRACPQRHLDRTCGGCGQKGHTSQGCPDRESWICKNCAQSGHGHWECTKRKGYRRKRCQLCHSLGHTAPNCENRPKPKPGNATKNPLEYEGSQWTETGANLYRVRGGRTYALGVLPNAVFRLWQIWA
ncbi:hypothetical protein LXA43DRAFT_725840 [Ganoderma leucocontextum]|nr:hypothetical protein LXA43DRAFT_725840 [Ganoderma leucocontextum]